jgi:hypothetical protein
LEPTSAEKPAPAAARTGWQFGLLSLLGLTSVSAAVLAVLRPLQLPPYAKMMLGGYALVLTGYVLLRGIQLVQRAMRLRRQVLANRQALGDWIEEKRRQAATTKETDSAL